MSDLRDTRLEKSRALEDLGQGPYALTFELSHRMAALQEAHADLMRLGAFWKGREAEVFGGAYVPSEQLEPRPGSAEDR